MTMPSNTMYQSFQGPTDTSLRMGPVEGYTQVSRVGEQVQNCFVDGYEYGTLADTFTDKEIKGEVYSDGKGKFMKADDDNEYTVEPRPVVIEYRPHFYEWATATVGMIALARRQRSTFRNYVAAEAAAPVMVCAALKGPLDETDWMFAGIVRSNCVRTMDDAVGPTTDEYFTVTIGGPQTILNNSNEVVHVGDTLAWTFYSENDKTSTIKRQRTGAPRRVGLRIASYMDDCKIGRALTFARPGQPLDILCSM